MRWRVVWRSRSRADLDALTPQVRRRALDAINRLSETGYGNLRQLHGSGDPEWRLRVGDWRVILTFDYPNSAFTVLRIQHRREVYRER